MIELKGKYNTAKVFTDNIDTFTISQIIDILNQESLKDSKIRIMPDCHAGTGCVVGTTMTIKDKIIPGLVGCDIGCGMSAYKLKEDQIDFKKFDDTIYKYVPNGATIHKTPVATMDLSGILAPININLIQNSIGSLGGGNHFIEIDKDKTGAYWLVIHSGSRHLGIEVCNYYQNLAYDQLKAKNANGQFKVLQAEYITKLKATGRQKEISKLLPKFKEEYMKKYHTNVPYELAYLEGSDIQDYLNDMGYVQKYAALNRKTIASEIMSHMGLTAVEEIETIHNYIDLDHMILRKGAVSANLGEKLIIPMNMRDGILICKGKGNTDWNNSAPHGAGRILSRSKAKENISLDDYIDSMRGIYSSSVGIETIDESPFVYKPIDEIIQNVQDSVEIIDIIKPVYNFKASELPKEYAKNIGDVKEKIYTEDKDEVELQ